MLKYYRYNKLFSVLCTFSELIQQKKKEKVFTELCSGVRLNTFENKCGVGIKDYLDKLEWINASLLFM